MTAEITFFPVDNGDMTLITLADKNKTSILIDINIRKKADDGSDDTFDAAKALREKIQFGSDGRPYIDVFSLTHPDKDHCTGLCEHFYLGDIKDYPDDQKNKNEKRIIIRELWSSPIVYKRASKNHTLCDDAKAFNKEAKRRVEVNKDNNFIVSDGDRILILGEDEGDKTNGLDEILVKVDETFNKIKGSKSDFFEALLIAPRPILNDDDEDILSKNNSSVILNIKIAASKTVKDGCSLLTGGDAEVTIWERVWAKYKNEPEKLEYDLLQVPHHCSLHSLSYDSWSECAEKVVISADALSSLSQAKDEASIVSSSKPIKNGDSDPPCTRAKREYVKIIDDVEGIFHCTGEYPKESEVNILTFKVGENGGIGVAKEVAKAATISISTPPSRAG